jgi:glycosyltransferase involved in cell wall biosynthesis
MAKTTMRVLIELGSSDTKVGAVGEVLDLAHYVRPLGVGILFCGPLDRTARAHLRQLDLVTVRGQSRAISKLGFPLYAISVLVWLARLLWLRPHVVHINYVSWGPSLACAAYLLGIPVVARAGSQGFNPRNWSHRWITAYAGACEVLCRSLKNSPLADRVFIMGDLFRPDRLHEPDVPFRPIPPRKDGRLRFLFLGQLVERKGIAFLVEAFSRIEVDADLLLVGGDWNTEGYPQEIRNLIGRLGLGDRVHLENHRPDIAVLMRRCDVFVLPSLSDARPRSIMEAMSQGLPVVSTAVGNIPTLIQDGVTGLLVPPSDPAALSVALNRLALSPELRKHLGEAARAKSAAECQPEQTARRFVELYQHVAASRPAPVSTGLPSGFESPLQQVSSLSSSHGV